jgi:hypothetical protein
MAYTLTPDELEATWGSRENGHPLFTRSVHYAAMLRDNSTPKDYWVWLSIRSGYAVWTPETGWLI